MGGALRYLSVCSGVEAASLAWEPLGWVPVAFAEVEPQACAVLASRWHHVPNIGDITQVSASDIAALGPIDLIVGGTPCQDLSVAGKRSGLAGERSSLFFDFVRIFHAARSHCGARWALWENVPGALNVNAGRDFASVVGALAGCELATPPEGWGSEGVALGEHGLVEWAVLDAQWFGVAQRRARVFAVLDTGDWADRPPVLLEPDRMRGGSAPSRPEWDRVAGVPAPGAHPVGFNGQDAYSGQLIEVGAGRAPAVAFDWQSGGDARGMVPRPTAQLQRSQVPAVSQAAGAVRRLTPRECERLQGMPDDHTLVQYRGKPMADAPRYRMIGNSMAVPVMRWIGEQISEAHGTTGSSEL